MTSSATTPDRAHPVAVALSGFEHELDALRDRPTWTMDAAATRHAMVTLSRVQARLAELEARLAAHGRVVEVEADSGATSTANWWAHATGMTRRAAHRKTRLADALASEVHEPVRVALADGELLVEQAEAIIAAVDALPADLDTGTRISPGLARRLACQAGIIPAVLGGNSEVLDLGRTRRFHTRAQRIALGITQRGCTAEGCDWPPG